MLTRQSDQSVADHSDMRPPSGLALAAPEAQRNYLFLQGPIGPFFSMLADRLRQAGHRVHRINFNGGDRVFWNLPGAVDYRSGPERWPRFFVQQLGRWNITDVLLFGDCRPLHRAANELARLRGIPVHVFEEGYLRPNWVTLETGGVNKNSSMPRDPEWYKAAAASISWDGGAPVVSSFVRRAAQDVLYNLSTVLFAWAYPGYRSHKPWHPLVEYAAGAKRFPLKPFNRRRVAEALAEVKSRRQPYYLFPLQLDADSQIRFHSPFGRMQPAIGKVIDSFARCAPADAHLVVTEHPLDTGVVALRRITRDHAEAAGVSRRVVYLEGGSPDELLRQSRGMITVNSTMGILALTFGIPVVALGHAIYDMPGLTFQGTLDDFWRGAAAPDAQTFDSFRRVVAARTQVNGGFYCRKGLELAVEGAAKRLALAAQEAQIRFPASCSEDQSDLASGRSPEPVPPRVSPRWDDAEAAAK